jgi:hypothetical protein
MLSAGPPLGGLCFLLAFGVMEIVVRELRPFRFQFALGDVSVAFDSEGVHINLIFCRQRGETFLFTSQTRAQDMTHHESERDHHRCHQASRHGHFD